MTVLKFRFALSIKIEMDKYYVMNLDILFAHTKEIRRKSVLKTFSTKTLTSTKFCHA